MSWYRAENDATDFAGNNNGALVGNATFAAGKVGQAFSFDGAGDSVVVPDAHSLDLTTALTLEAWVFPTAASGDPDQVSMILSKEQRDSASAGPTQYEIGRRNNRHPGFGIPEGNFAFFLGGVVGLPDDDTGWVDGKANLPLDTWSHVAVTFDGTSVRAYVNGTLTRQIVVSGTIAVSNGDLHIGARDSDLNQAWWSGKIDEPMVSNRALSQAEIQSIFAAASDGMATLVVNTTSDTVDPADDVLSLREAILASNASVGKRDVIGFNIPGAGLHNISLGSALPTITDTAVIDGYTQPGAKANTNAIDDPNAFDRTLNGTLLVQITPDAAAGAINGLRITGSEVTVRGLVINGFEKAGIQVTGDNNLIAGNYIGTNDEGSEAAGNGSWGVQITAGATGNVIGTNADGVNDAAERNLISGNIGGGVDISGVGTDFNVVAGNFIGTERSGNQALPNSNRGVDIRAGAQHNRIGVNPGGNLGTRERNVISGNGWEGIGIYDSGTALNLVSGNYVGTDNAGIYAAANGRSGVAVFGGSTGNTIGGNAAGLGNLISGNGLDGVEISSQGTADNHILGNLIGPGSNGTYPMANLRDGIRVWHGALRTTIGGEEAGAANVIALNRGNGVSVLSSNTSDTGILANSIYRNLGLGIDLGGDGPTRNDRDDADGGANALQNYPVLIGASLGNEGQLLVSYSVPSAPPYSRFPVRVEFFKVDADEQGKMVFLGSDLFEATEVGTGPTIVLPTAVPLGIGDQIVATATDNYGSNTSEFSSAVMVRSNEVCSPIVLNTNDSGAGSLRDAISCANATNGLATISFDIPGTGVHTISPLSPLPTLNGGVTIDGYTQPGSSPNTSASGENARLLIELNGSLAGSDAVGLALGGTDSAIRGLVINRFDVGIRIQFTEQNVIAGNFIGTDATGTTDLGNRSYGILIARGSQNRIGGSSPADRNVIAGNDGDGVRLLAADNNIISGNIIGKTSLGNGKNGIQIGGYPQLLWQAENFSSRSSFGGQSWTIVPEEDAGTSVHKNYLGSGYLQLLADTGTTNTPSTGSPFESSPIASYDVTISEPGTYQLYVRWDGHDGMSDSFYARVSELTDGTGGAADWYRFQHLANLNFDITPWQGTGGLERTDASGNDVAATWNFSKAGKYTIQLGFREDGVAVDALLLQLASLPAPTGNGPTEFGNSNRNMVGGVGGLGNVIAGNGAAGVALNGGLPIENSILGNSVFGNTGLGIDLGANGATPNDAGDTDSGPNQQQNFPVVSAATVSAGKLKVTYTVDSNPANSTYPLRVEFFKADADGLEGQVYLGFDTFTAADFAAGGKTATVATAITLSSHDKIVATATDSLAAGGTANTSEFSASTTIIVPWQNPQLRWDVTSDGHVVAEDVLAIINYINAKGAGTVPDGAASVKPFYDVNGDNNVAADDVIAVVNYINAGLGGEGEAAVSSASDFTCDDQMMRLLAMDLAEQGTRKRK